MGGGTAAWVTVTTVTVVEVALALAVSVTVLSKVVVVMEVVVAKAVVVKVTVEGVGQLVGVTVLVTPRVWVILIVPVLPIPAANTDEKKRTKTTKVVADKKNLPMMRCGD